jgi:hypothetical protein
MWNNLKRNFIVYLEGYLTRQNFSRLEWEMSWKIPEGYPLQPVVEDFTKIPERFLIGSHARLGCYTREGIAVRAPHSGAQALPLVLKVSCPDRVKTR